MAFLQWGSASATDVVIRFGVNAPEGTYAVAFRSFDTNTSYVAEYVISAEEAGTDVIKEVAVPGPTMGNWPTGETRGMAIDFVFAAGSSLQTTAGAWQSGNFIGTANVSNGQGSTSNVFEIFDVGLRADSEGTGEYGEYTVPLYADVNRRCWRYAREVGFATNGYGNTSAALMNVPLGEPMKAGTISATLINATDALQRFGTGNFTISSLGSPSYDADAACLNIQCNGTYSAGGFFSGRRNFLFLTSRL